MGNGSGWKLFSLKKPSDPKIRCLMAAKSMAFLPETYSYPLDFWVQAAIQNIDYQINNFKNS
jgi:hypothetical protein